MMTVADLINHLQDLVNSGEVDQDSEVRLAQQPNWPLQCHVGQVVVSNEGADLEDEIEDLRKDVEYGNGDAEEKAAYAERIAELEAKIEDAPKIVYIAEAQQVYDTPYLPGAVSRELGWK